MAVSGVYGITSGSGSYKFVGSAHCSVGNSLGYGGRFSGAVCVGSESSIHEACGDFTTNEKVTMQNHA